VPPAASPLCSLAAAAKVAWPAVVLAAPTGVVPSAEGYESLSEIRLSAKKRNALSLLLADTRLRDADAEEEHLQSSFITRVQDISGQLPSNRSVGLI